MSKQIDYQRLVERGKEILYNNWRDGFTVPTDRLYPFQWNWDSGFVSLGFANFNVDYAISEINSLLKGQWENGMIPHIIFHSETEKTYFPNWDFWKSNVNKGAPTTPKTSGITQPPVLGFVLENIYKKHPSNPKVKAFIKEVFPKVVNYHKFWYNYRDPNKEGLVFIYHPWESGRDNSPIWDDALSLIDLNSAKLPSYQRRDITIADSSERPTSTQYDQYVYLLMLGQKHKYDGPGIAEESEFLIQDTMMNALLIASNQSLINLGEEFGFDTGQIKEWQQQSIKTFEEKLWDDKIQSYTGYDLRQSKNLGFKEIGSFCTLFAGFPNEARANKLIYQLEDLIKRDFLVTPSFDVDHELFDSKRYWRGPIWPQMNWLIHHGLKKYGREDLAEHVKDDLINLVSKFGFHEYFEAQRDLVNTTHGGYGGEKFSWTASSIIDLIHS